MEPLYEWIIARARWIIAATLLVTVFFGWHASRITVDSSIEALLPQDDPDQRYYAEIRKLYGSDEIGFIGVFADDVYRPAVLEKIPQAARARMGNPCFGRNVSCISGSTTGRSAVRRSR
jgi:predicted RND superfamily exporter protein